MNNVTRILLAAAIVAGLAGCATKPKKEVVAEPTHPTKNDTTTASSTDGKFTQSDLETNACLRQRVVYFDFDKAEVRAEAQAILKCHAKYLNDQPTSRMTLEGHADERGTREYNLGLGERRGKAVEGALQANGASSAQLNNVSYGEERPTCTESNEGCWAKNRRVEIVYTAK